MSQFIESIDTRDLRLTTSQHEDGPDAMNPDPDQSDAYVTLLNSPGAEGYGLAFTVRKCNDVQVAAVRFSRHSCAGRWRRMSSVGSVAPRLVSASCAGSDGARGSSTWPRPRHEARSDGGRRAPVPRVPHGSNIANRRAIKLLEEF